MMKLTKEEIQFIDQYLIKNKVKFWDLRLELLDHVVSSVEDKINDKGTSFNEALLEVHQGFGNQVHNFGVNKKRQLLIGLYQNNIGFEKFTRQKQKELGRAYRIKIWQVLKALFVDFKFIIELIALTLLFLILYKWSPKYTSIIGLVVLMTPFFCSFIHAYKDKSTRESLSLSIVNNMGFLFFSVYNMVLQMFGVIYEKGEPKPYIILVIFTIISYPIIRAQLTTYFKTYKENKRIYDLKLS